MNAPVLPSEMKGTPLLRLPPGIQRRLWTIDDVLAMQDAGILDERCELIEGEIVPKMSKGSLHELFKLALIEFLVLALAGRYRIGAETSLRLSDRSVPDPDVSVLPLGKATLEVTGPETLLAVEVTHKNRKLDLRVKPPLYAKYGVPHLWVIDVRDRQLHVYSGPTGAGYLRHDTLDEHTAAPLPFAPEISVRLADLK